MIAMFRFWPLFLPAAVIAYNSSQPDSEQCEQAPDTDVGSLLQPTLAHRESSNRTGTEVDGTNIVTTAAALKLVATIMGAQTLLSNLATHKFSWEKVTKDVNVEGWEQSKLPWRRNFVRWLPGNDAEGVDFQRGVGIFTVGAPGVMRPAP